MYIYIYISMYAYRDLCSCIHIPIYLSIVFRSMHSFVRSVIYPSINYSSIVQPNHFSIYFYIYPDIHVTLSLGIYVWYARTLCNLWEAIDLLGKRIVSTTTAGYIQITSGGLIGTIGSSIRIHLIQSRIGQSSRYGITGYTMRSQVRSFLSHLSTGRNTRSI